MSAFSCTVTTYDEGSVEHKISVDYIIATYGQLIMPHNIMARFRRYHLVTCTYIARAYIIARACTQLGLRQICQHNLRHNMRARYASIMG